MTPEDIINMITAARDSVTVINEALQKISGGATLDENLNSLISRNVEHLKIVTGKEEIVTSGHNISDLFQAIEQGEAAILGE
jgi:hypothetical protein